MCRVASVVAILGLISSCMGPPRAPVIPELVHSEATVAPDLAASSVSSIDIRCSASLAGEQVELLESHGTRQRLHNELVEQLGATGRFGSGGEIELVIEIRDFRLRSHSAAFNGGAFSGADALGVRCEVSRQNAPSRAFETGTSTILGGLEYQYEDERLDRLAKELAKRILAGLK